MKALETALPLTPAQCERTGQRRLHLEITDERVEVLISGAAGQSEHMRSSIAFDQMVKPIAKAVEELVYANPLLLCDFAKVTIILRNDRAELVPEGFGQWHQTDSDTETLVQTLVDGKTDALCKVDSQLLKFLRRTFNAPLISGHMAPLCNYLLSDSRRGNRPKAYLQVNSRYADVVIVNRDGLQHAATYGISSAADAVYFTLAAIESVGFDRLDGECMVFGSSDMRRQVLGPLRKYINSVMPLIIPADFDPDSPLELNGLQ